MKVSRVLTLAFLLPSSTIQAGMPHHSIEQIKIKLGHLISLVITHNQRLHPREMLRLFIHLLQHHCAVDPKPQVTQLCATLQGLLQENDAEKILKAIEKYCSQDLLPPHVVERLKKLTITEKLQLRTFLNKRLKERYNQERAIHELEQQAFQQYL